MFRDGGIVCRTFRSLKTSEVSKYAKMRIHVCVDVNVEAMEEVTLETETHQPLWKWMQRLQ